MKLYESLGVKANAVKADIKKAYRKLAKKHHPDRGGDEAMFKEIQKAYDVLGDASKREHYDRTGDTNTVKEGPERILMSIFNAIIQSGEFHGNLIDRVFNKMRDEIEILKKSKSKVSADIKKLNKLKGRLSTDGENLFELMLQGSIGELTTSLDAKEAQITQMTGILEMLSDYSDDKPEAKQEQYESPLHEFMDLSRRQGFGQGPFGQGGR